MMAALLAPHVFELLDLADEVIIDDDVPQPRRYLRDIGNPLELYTDKQFQSRYRFSKEIVRLVILPLLGLEEPNNFRGLPLTPVKKLLVALRFYATGNFQVVCGDLAGVHASTVCRIVKRVSGPIAQNLRHWVKFPNGANEVLRNRLRFYDIGNFPGVIGAIDCTHIRIKSPGGARGEVYRNRKGYFSLNVQVVAGSQMDIMDIVCRWPGSTHDSRIFANSGVKAKFEDGRLQGGILLGDSGYPQLLYLFTPILEHAVHTDAERRYNRAHKRTRNIVERLFGVWKQRFPCLQLMLRNKLQTTAAIIVACAVLHNIGIAHNDHVEGIHLEACEEVAVDDAQQRPGRAVAIRNAFFNRHFN